MRTYLDMPAFETKYKDYITGNLIRNIFVNRYPGDRLFIIRGYDKFSEETYTEDVFFNFQAAFESIKKIPPNGDTEEISDSYYLIIGTPVDLENGNVKDPKTQEPLDYIDIKKVYDKIKAKLREAVI